MKLIPVLLLAASLCSAHEGHEHEAAHAVTLEAERLLEVFHVQPPPEAARLVFEFEDPQREQFDFLPMGMRSGSKGVLLADMSLPLQRSTHAILREVLSQEGYLRVQTIRSLEEVLRAVEGGNELRDPEAYGLRFFGTPAHDAPWSLRFEGHHVSIHATLADGVLRGTPLFLGASPAEVQSGAYVGLRALQPQQDLARELLVSLSREQREEVVQAAYSPAHRIQVGPLGGLGEPVGLAAAAMTPFQRELLLRLIASYAGNLRADFAAEELARVDAAGVDTLHFLWRGGTQPGEACSYRVQGPTLVLDYDLIGGAADMPADHVHTLWRDPARDFGADLLALHLAEEHGEER